MELDGWSITFFKKKLSNLWYSKMIINLRKIHGVLLIKWAALGKLILAHCSINGPLTYT